MYNNFPTTTQSILAFSQFLRKEGMNIGIQESLDMMDMAGTGLIADKQRFFYATKAIFCCTKEESVAYKKLFDKFWTKEGTRVRGKISKKGILKRTNVPASIVMLGMGESKESEEEEESREVSGANKVQRLRKTDFSKLSEMDSEYLEDLAKRLWKQMSLRMKRRMKRSEKQGIIDLRKTIRRSISNGGDPIAPVFKKRQRRKQKLVVLLDVSGSMDKYSFFLLRFVCALKEHFKAIEAFLFSTELVRISEYLEAGQLAQTLNTLSMKANNWSSGTTIGDCLHTFNVQHAKQCLSGQSTVIILSDGLDTGEPGKLALELSQIRMRADKLIWLNPLKGMEGFRPTARGMEAALPHLDIFRSAHNLNSLLELEEFLIHV